MVLTQYQQDVLDYVSVALTNSGLTEEEKLAVASNVWRDPSHCVHRALQRKRGRFIVGAPNMANGVSSSMTSGSIVEQRGENGVKKKGRREVVVSGQFTPAEEAMITGLFDGEISIAFRLDRRNPHQVAAAIRKIEHYLVMTAVKFADRVVDIGGNIVWHASNNGKPVHCCNPVLDVRDQSRWITRDQNLKERMALTWFGDRYNYRQDPTRVMCSQPAHLCTAQAEVMVMFHVYDIPIATLGDIMERHGANYLYGTMMMPQDRRWGDSGVIPVIQAKYLRVGDKIQFSFDKDSSLEYEHEASVLEGYLHDTIVRSKSGVDYIYEITQSKAYGITFRVIRSYENVAPIYRDLATTVRHQQHKVMRLKSYKYNVFADKEHALQPYYIECPASVFELVYGKALTLSDDLFTKQQVVAQLRTYNNGFSANGVKLLPDQRIKAADLGAVGVVIYLLALKKRTEMTDIVTMFGKHEDANRSFGANGLVAKAAKTAAAWWYEKGMQVIDGANNMIDAVANVFNYTEDVEAVLLDALSCVDTNMLMSKNVIPPVAHIENYKVDIDFEGLLDVARECMDWESSFEDVLGEAEKMEVLIPEATVSQSDSASETMADSMDITEDEQLDYVSLTEKTLDIAKGFQGVAYEEEQTDYPFDTASESWTANFTEDAASEHDRHALAEAIDYIQAERNGKLGTAIKIADTIWRGGNVDCVMQQGLQYKGNPRVVHTRLALLEGHGRKMYNLIEEPVHSFYMIGYDLDTSTIVSSRTIYTNGTAVAAAWSKSVKNLFVCDDFEVWIYEEKLKVYREILAHAYDNNLGMPAKVVANVGPPGCAKSKFCQQQCKENLAAGLEFAVTVRSKSSRNCLANHMVHSEYGIIDAVAVKNKVRTSDSFLLHFKDKVDILHVDEAFMMHYGEVVGLSILSGAKEVHLYGDPVQIRFVERIKMGLLYTGDFQPDSARLMRCSERCSPYMIAAISSAYNDSIYSMKDMDGHVPPEFMPIAGVDDIPKDDSITYICPYKDDRAEMRKKGYKNLYTPEQIQGDTLNNVILVQLSNVRKNMFNQRGFMVVSFSRNTGWFKFASVDHDADNLARKFIRDGSNLAKVRAAKYNPKTHGPRITEVEGVDLNNLY